MSDPAQHEAHDLPLLDRIIDRAIGTWLDRQSAIALAAAGSGSLSDYERGVRQGIERMQHLYLSGWSYAVVPALVDELKRAGLLAEHGEQS